MNTWWDDDPAQRYWMQITDRDHLAGLLQSPKLPHLTWGSDLASQLQPGDRVLHGRHARHLGWSEVELISLIGELSTQSEEFRCRWAAHDVRFHRTIARAAGNPILGALMETITANLYEHRSLTVQRAQDLKESAEMHREIYRAIRSHNPALARQAMEQHLNLARTAQAAEIDTAPAVDDEANDVATETKTSA